MSRIGFEKTTGRKLTGIDHLRQSIADILTTPIGTRVMRRDYGSGVQDLVDAPMNDDTIIKIFSATAIALDKWEPRFKLSHLKSTEITENGRLSLTLDGEYLGDLISIDGVIL